MWYLYAFRAALQYPACIIAGPVDVDIVGISKVHCWEQEVRDRDGIILEQLVASIGRHEANRTPEDHQTKKHCLRYSQIARRISPS